MKIKWNFEVSFLKANKEKIKDSDIYLNIIYSLWIKNDAFLINK